MSIEIGNAREVGGDYHGWIVGSFMRGDHAPLYSNTVEVKWACHAAGEHRAGWAPAASHATISILVRGRFVLTFDSGEHLLAREGDFAFWSAGEAHTWRAEEESVIVTVRWRETSPAAGC